MRVCRPSARQSHEPAETSLLSAAEHRQLVQYVFQKLQKRATSEMKKGLKCVSHPSHKSAMYELRAAWACWFLTSAALAQILQDPKVMTHSSPGPP